MREGRPKDRDSKSLCGRVVRLCPLRRGYEACATASCVHSMLYDWRCRMPRPLVEAVFGCQELRLARQGRYHSWTGGDASHRSGRETLSYSSE
jgi:hypothetical protein